jgi:hypothetical protein
LRDHLRPELPEQTSDTALGMENVALPAHQRGLRRRNVACLRIPMICFVALQFMRVEGGLAPGDAAECSHAAAIRRAEGLHRLI